MAKVAVVDDAAEALDLMARMLRAAGHQVVTYGDGNGLEEKLSAERPDMVLLDIVMPERNGFQILRSLKRGAQTKSLPVVLVSSKTEPSDIEWGKLQGADDYLTKPFTAQQLLASVSRFAR
ncbi:MAG TPA: response regulator [Thermoanaerobaculia bacterium]|nr:response regulator [Thermoanaerobaculia bacterium]